MQDAPMDITATRTDRSGEGAAETCLDAKFVTPGLQRIIGVWEAHRGARTLPARGDLTLTDLKFALPQLAVLDIVNDGQRTRFKVRLMGGELDRFLTPMTGRFIDEAVPSPFAENWTSLMSPAIQRRAPTRSLSRTEYRDRRGYLVEALYAPLADDGETPDRLLVACYYHLYQGVDDKLSKVAEQLLGELDQPPSD
jgi:hypothetical protein